VPCRRLLPGVYFTQIALHVTTVLSLSLSRLPSFPSAVRTLFNGRRTSEATRAPGKSRRDINVSLATLRSRSCDRSRIRIGGSSAQRGTETCPSRVTCHVLGNVDGGRREERVSRREKLRKARARAGSREGSRRFEGMFQLGSLVRAFRDSSRASLEKQSGAERERPAVSALSSGHVAADATFIDRPSDLGGAPRRRGQCVHGANARCALIRGHSPPA